MSSSPQCNLTVKAIVVWTLNVLMQHLKVNTIMYYVKNIISCYLAILLYGSNERMQ